MPHHFSLNGKAKDIAWALARIKQVLGRSWSVIDGIVYENQKDWVTVSWINGTVSDEYIGTDNIA